MSNLRRPDARSQLVELKRHLLAVMNAEQRLYQRYTESRREADRWRQRAGLAVRRGDDDLARAALARSGKHEADATEFHHQYLEQKQYVEELKRRLLDLESQSLRRPAAVGPVDLARLERNLIRLEHWEDRAREERARLAAWAELDRDELSEKLAALEREDQLDRQLAELKQKLGRE